MVFVMEGGTAWGKLHWGKEEAKGTELAGCTDKGVDLSVTLETLIKNIQTGRLLRPGRRLRSIGFE